MKERLFSQIRPRSIIAVVILSIVIAFASHFVISNPLGPARLVYPIEAWAAQLQMRCSLNAPDWLGNGLWHATSSQGALANQIVYLDPEGALHHCENGWAGNLLRSPKLAADTRFRFASVTKLFTADAVLSLVNSGALGLDTRLLDLFPEVLPVKDQRLERMTVAHLLSHTAGFDRSNGQDPMFLLNVKPWCPTDLSKLSTLTLSFDPGSKYGYSNLGYCLLGAIIERVSGKPYRVFMEEEYGLSASGLAFVDGPYLPDEVKYDFRNSNFYGEDYFKYFDFEAVSSSAGLSGNASALAKQIQKMLARQPLSLLSGRPLEGCNLYKLRECYGYGGYFYRKENSDLELYMHGGLFPGNVTLAMIDSEGGVTVWLSAGQPLEGFRKTAEMYEYLYQALGRYYAELKGSDRF